MSHYGYVSEQLLNGGLVPRRPHRRERRGWRLRREAPSLQSRSVEPPVERPVEVDRIRGYLDLPATGR
jgi:hypothetical protein